MINDLGHPTALEPALEVTAFGAMPTGARGDLVLAGKMPHGPLDLPQEAVGITPDGQAPIEVSRTHAKTIAAARRADHWPPRTNRTR